MTKFSKFVLAAAVASPALIAAAAPAAAQSVAVLDPEAAVQDTNAWKTAASQLQTTYKSQIDQINARRQAITTQMQGLLKQFDTNGDGQLSQEEIQAAQTSKGAQWRQAEAQQTSGNEELARLAQPIQRARAYALEQIQNHEDEAVQNVVKQRNISVLLRPQAAFYANPTADLTSAVTAELNRLVPGPVGITPPANWQPGQENQAAPTTAPAPAATTGGRNKQTGR